MNKQLTVKELIIQLQQYDESLPVYFRRVAPITGNVEEAYLVEQSTVSSFGIVEQVIIIEPDRE